MRINTLSDKLPDVGEFNRLISRARSKKCLVPKTDGFKIFRNWDEAELKRNPRLRYHVNSVLDASEKDERVYHYMNLYGDVEGCLIYMDSHNEIEKLGVQQYFTGKVVIVTMDQFLDIALQKCCKADPANVRTIRDYDNISFLAMNMALHQGNEPVYFSRFQGFDDSLDRFLLECSRDPIWNLDDNEESGHLEIVCRIYSGILSAASLIMMNCIRVLCHEFNLAIRSQGPSSFVLSPNPKNPDVVIPDYIDYTDESVSFRLPILTLRKWEYTDYLRRK